MVIRNVLVSGAGGFVGQKLVENLAAKGHTVSALHRRDQPNNSKTVRWIKIGDLAGVPLNPKIGAGIDIFINLAAPLRATSTDSTGSSSKAADIARNVSDFIQAAKIPRVIVLSSIASSLAERAPKEARRYGIEKLAADRVFQERLGGPHKIIYLRPPAVYGPGMYGSLGTLAKIVRRGLPIPLGLAKEPRHYISLHNLTDLIETITGSDEAVWQANSGRMFEPSDGQAISTRDLIRMMGQAMGRPAHLLPAPLGVLRALGALSGKSEMISGAIDRLDVAPVSEIEAAFGWRPIETMPASLSFLRSA